MIPTAHPTSCFLLKRQKHPTLKIKTSNEIIIKIIWKNSHLASTRLKNPFGDSGMLCAPGNRQTFFLPPSFPVSETQS